MSTKPRQSQNPNPGPKPGQQFNRPVRGGGPLEGRAVEILQNPPPTPPPKVRKFKSRPKKHR